MEFGSRASEERGIELGFVKGCAGSTEVALVILVGLEVWARIPLEIEGSWALEK